MVPRERFLFLRASSVSRAHILKPTMPTAPNIAKIPYSKKPFIGIMRHLLGEKVMVETIQFHNE
jgi:hypothetical protein